MPYTIPMIKKDSSTIKDALTIRIDRPKAGSMTFVVPSEKLRDPDERTGKSDG